MGGILDYPYPSYKDKHFGINWIQAIIGQSFIIFQVSSIMQQHVYSLSLGTNNAQESWYPKIEHIYVWLSDNLFCCFQHEIKNVNRRQTAIGYPSDLSALKTDMLTMWSYSSPAPPNEKQFKNRTLSS